MYLYVFEGFDGGPERQKKSEELVKKATKMYLQEQGISCDDMSWEINRSTKGKPYYTQIPVEFSISHTGSLWVCLLTYGGGSVGVDVQAVRKSNFNRVAAKYFTASEREFINEDPDAFFQLWTRKEAYAKYTGKGITQELADFDTLNNNDVRFVDFAIKAGVKGSCCITEKGDLCLRMI